MHNHEIDLNHGDWLVSVFDGEKLYRYRCGPVVTYRRRHGRIRSAFGSMREPRTIRSIRLALAHAQEGIHVRANGNRYLPTAWDDRWARGTKSWKYYRDTQYR